MNAIGGYFQLELPKGKIYHEGAIALNTGRNALEYILRVRKYEKIHIPYFTCDVLLEPIQKLGIDFVFYNIDELLEPNFEYDSIRANEGFLYTNYFGLKDEFIAKLAVKCNNLIIDNAQSFYSKPLPNIDTFYSPRKFFGLPDGAYLFCDEKLLTNLNQDFSYGRFEHLLRRTDVSAEDGYSYFIENDKSLSNQTIKKMSNLTQALLKAIDYRETANIRKENYAFLHNQLKEFNLLKLNFDGSGVPMVYPFWNRNKELRQHLINNKVYTATYWPNVKEWVESNSLEYRLTDEVIYFPIDQRYGKKEMELIGKMVLDV